MKNAFLSASVSLISLLAACGGTIEPGKPADQPPPPSIEQPPAPRPISPLGITLSPVPIVRFDTIKRTLKIADLQVVHPYTTNLNGKTIGLCLDASSGAFGSKSEFRIYEKENQNRIIMSGAASIAANGCSIAETNLSGPNKTGDKIFAPLVIAPNMTGRYEIYLHLGEDASLVSQAFTFNIQGIFTHEGTEVGVMSASERLTITQQ